jgi:DNA polymerase
MEYTSMFDQVSSSNESLEEIRNDLGDCVRCKLAPTRKNIVFGSGNPRAELMFVGEAPGADEDEQGLPFVGRAGQLLTKIIEAMGLKREEVYICNILKCRPPNNRNPETDEITSCEPFLFRQIESVKPKVICALGAFGAQTLLHSTESIGRLRGKLIDYRGAGLMATYHPAYLLRNPMEKRKVWEDMQVILDFLKQSKVKD